MIRDLFDFRWPDLIKTDMAKRDRSRRCTYHKDHNHTTKQCRSLHYLVERLIRAEHLKQYVRTTGGQRETTQDLVVQALASSAVPRVVINYIHGGPVDERYNSKWKRQRLLHATFVREWVSSVQHNFSKESMHLVDGTITFAIRVLQPHENALVLTLGISGFDLRRVLVNPSSSIDLLQMLAYKQMGHSPSVLENLGRLLYGFNGATTTSQGDVVLPVQVDPVTFNVQFSMVKDLSHFQCHYETRIASRMKVVPSTYH